MFIQSLYRHQIKLFLNYNLLFIGGREHQGGICRELRWSRHWYEIRKKHGSSGEAWTSKGKYLILK